MTDDVMLFDALDEGEVTGGHPPAAIMPENAARAVLAEMAMRDVRAGGTWHTTPVLWRRYDRGWDSMGDAGRGQAPGQPPGRVGTPTRYEITIYRCTITREGQAAGWDVMGLTNEALGFGGLDLATCPRRAALRAAAALPDALTHPRGRSSTRVRSRSWRGPMRTSVDGVRCAAWLYRPDGEGPHPCVVMAHGFSATRSDSLPPYAEAFAAAGLAVLLFDYRCFGDSDGEPRQLLDVKPAARPTGGRRSRTPAVSPTSTRADRALGLELQRRPRDHARERGPRASPRWSRRPRTSTAWRRCGSWSRRSWRKASMRAVRDQLAAAARPQAGDAAAGRRPRDSTAALTAPEVVPGFAKIVSPGTRWRNEVTASALLQVPFYSPARKIGSASPRRC